MSYVSKKASFLIYCSVGEFTGWLEAHTRGLPEISISLEKGRIIPDFARKSRENGNKLIWNIRGIHFYRTKSNPTVETERNTAPIVQFQVIPLGDGRLEVVSTCIQPFMEDYFYSLKQAILLRWPARRYKAEGTGKELFPSKAAKAQKSSKNAFAPRRPGNLRRWRFTWQKIKPMVEEGYTPAEIFDTMKNKEKFKGVLSGTDTLRKIIRAGMNKELDD